MPHKKPFLIILKIAAMNKIKIKIPDGLTPKEEVIQIAKRLNQKALSRSGKQNKSMLLGTGKDVEIQHIQTEIIITRVSKEKPIEYITCNVCNSEYQSDTAQTYWHNYGGKPKEVKVCSETCKHIVLQFLGDRAAPTKTKLKRLKFF